MHTFARTIKRLMLRAATSAFTPPTVFAEEGNPVTADHIRWAYRLMLDREPESDAVIADKLRACPTTKALRLSLLTSEEFRLLNPTIPLLDDHNVIIKELADGLRLYIDLYDAGVGMGIIRGHYEQGEAAYVRRSVQPGQTVLDIGANIGFFTVTMAAQVGTSGHVYAYEPLDYNVALLNRSLAENQMQTRVTVQQVALSDKPGVTRMLLHSQLANSGGVQLFAAQADIPEGHETREVPLVTLDTADVRRPVSFIKIDIEGAEPLALRGARQLLQTDRPTVLSEIHPQLIRKVSGCTPAEYIGEMGAWGYACHLLTDDGHLAEAVTDVDDSQVWSVVFIPQQPA
jgi:FkbM family methyltransferase